MPLTFTQPLNPADIDPGGFSVKRWNYQRTGNYGSLEFSVTDPQKKERDKMEVTGAGLSVEGRTVTLKLADLRSANQMLIRFNLFAKDGTELRQDVLHTVHAVVAARAGQVN